MYNIVSSCKTTVHKMNSLVIEDVISQVRELFLDEDVDEGVLQTLKKMWETKLRVATRAKNSRNVDEQDSSNISGTAMNVQRYQQVPPNNHAQLLTTVVPINITIQRLLVPHVPQVLSLNVPACVWETHMIHKLLTPEILTIVMNLPQAIARNLLQQHVNAIFDQLQEVVRRMNNPVAQPNKPAICGNLDVENQKPSSTNDHNMKQIVNSSDNACDDKPPIDGSFSDNSSDDDSTDDNSADVSTDDGTGDRVSAEPLNSDDDITDEDTDDFETDNVIFCQFEKVTASRGRKWILLLMNGIMHLDGEDYVFQKAHGSAHF